VNEDATLNEADEITALVAQLASQLLGSGQTVSADDVMVTVTKNSDGTHVVRAEIAMDDEVAAAELKKELDSTSDSDLSAALAVAIGVEPQEVVSVESEVVSLDQESDQQSAAVIGGSVTGGVIVLALVAGGVFLVWRRRALEALKENSRPAAPQMELNFAPMPTSSGKMKM